MSNGRKQKSLGVTILVFVVAVVVVLLDVGEPDGSVVEQQRGGIQQGTTGEVGEAVIEGLVAARRSDEQVEIRARVDRVLSDDLEGDRHQRFIVRFEGSGRTVLISHNIDLAERVPLEEGDWVRVHGEYEWTERGGVIHWTHHNPARNPIHPPGWVEHNGVRYE